MKQTLSQIALVVDDYNKAIHYYTEVLGFTLLEDTLLEKGKRWVVVKPGNFDGCAILLAKAKNSKEANAIGNQCGGRVFLFLETDNFKRDYESYKTKGVEFEEPPRTEAYGTVAVFNDLYGNRWDLIERRT